jgi:hypothetical protein
VKSVVVEKSSEGKDTRGGRSKERVDTMMRNFNDRRERTTRSLSWRPSWLGETEGRSRDGERSQSRKRESDNQMGMERESKRARVKGSKPTDKSIMWMGDSQ